MNQIRAIQKINEAELQNGILKSEVSWHNEYKNQAYVFIGGLSTLLTEADILTIFSQFGVPVDIFLVRDQETGDSKGFAYLKYEDQRSTILAIDNLNGATIAGRAIKVDHAMYTPNSNYQRYREAVQQELRRDKVEVPVDLRIGEQKERNADDDNDAFSDPMAGFASDK